MYTLQGIISRSVNNADVSMDAMGAVSSNVANYNTVGYKCQRFETYLKESGSMDEVLRTDNSQGQLFTTERNLDVGINGPGYIPVTKKDGTTMYTRDGSFLLDQNGYLITQDKSIVGDGIKIPPDYYKLLIGKDGTVTALTAKDSDPQVLGKIPLVKFNNTEGLKAVDGNNLLATKESGEPILIKDTQSIKQGALERSNVDIASSVNDILRLNTGIIASTKLIKVVDDIYRQSINLQQ